MSLNRTLLPLPKVKNLIFFVFNKSTNSIHKNKKENNFNDTELNSLKYEDALKHDKRTYLQYL